MLVSYVNKAHLEVAAFEAAEVASRHGAGGLQAGEGVVGEAAIQRDVGLEFGDVDLAYLFLGQAAVAA